MTKVKRTKGKKETIIQKIEVSQNRRGAQDIDSWRNAIKAAESVFFPRRNLLYDLYSEILLDGHLTAVIEKRKLSVTNTPLVFMEGSKVNNDMTDIISTDIFMNLIGYILDCKIWGHSLIELNFNDGTLLPTLIPRKHVVPEKGIILRNQNDFAGFSYREYPYTNFLLEVGENNSLGLLMKAAQYVLYKRGGVGDWAQYCELFGMPFRVAKYDGYDEKTRSDLENALKAAGSAAYIVIPKEADLNFIQNNTTGSSILYDMMIDSCNKELSKLILGQTLTTESGGALAQAKVHQEVEQEIHFADKLFVKNVLNDKLIPLLKIHGFNTGNGKFVFHEKENIDKKTKLEMDLKLAKQIKIDDNYFYETYNIPKPQILN
jgi:phage gp29-like protein